MSGDQNNHSDGQKQFTGDGSDRESAKARAQVEGWLGITGSSEGLPEKPQSAKGSGLSDERFEAGWAAVQNRLDDSPTVSILQPYRIWLAAAAVLVFAAGIYLTAGNYFSVEPAGRLASAAGNLKIDGHPVPADKAAGTVLLPGTRIVSPKGGRYTIHFGEKSIIEVAGPSELVFMATGENGDKRTGQTGDGPRGTLILQRGELSAVIAEKWASLKVRTPNHTVEVTGTTFYQKVIDNNDSYFCICHGEVIVSHRGQDGKLRKRKHRAEHHFARRFRTEEGVTTSAKAKMAYHFDPQLEALAEEIGASIDWKLPE